MPRRDPWWEDEPTCKGMDTEEFFPETSRPPSVHAVQACVDCPVRWECLTDCMAEERQQRGQHVRYGLRGGATPQERRAVTLGTAPPFQPDVPTPTMRRLPRRWHLLILNWARSQGYRGSDATPYMLHLYAKAHPDRRVPRAEELWPHANKAPRPMLVPPVPGVGNRPGPVRRAHPPAVGDQGQGQRPGPVEGVA